VSQLCAVRGRCDTFHRCQCTPRTCVEAEAGCGSLQCGRGSSLSCGTCDAGSSCQQADSGAFACVAGPCTRTTTCVGKCETRTDNCGVRLNCGACTGLQVCGARPLFLRRRGSDRGTQDLKCMADAMGLKAVLDFVDKYDRTIRNREALDGERNRPTRPQPGHSNRYAGIFLGWREAPAASGFGDEESQDGATACGGYIRRARSIRRWKRPLSPQATGGHRAARRSEVVGGHARSPRPRRERREEEAEGGAEPERVGVLLDQDCALGAGRIDARLAPGYDALPHRVIRVHAIERCRLILTIVRSILVERRSLGCPFAPAGFD
jgi:hypothetical protein